MNTCRVNYGYPVCRGISGFPINNKNLKTFLHGRFDQTYVQMGHLKEIYSYLLSISPPNTSQLSSKNMLLLSGDNPNGRYTVMSIDSLNGFIANVLYFWNGTAWVPIS